MIALHDPPHMGHLPKRAPLIQLAVGFLLIALFWVLPLTPALDRLIYDYSLEAHARWHAVHAQRKDSEVVVLAIDEAALARTGRWPWSRHEFALLIERLATVSRAPLILDLILTEPTPEDARLARAMRRHGNVWLPEYIGVVERRPRLFPPAPMLEAAARGKGHIHLPLEDDGVVRRIQWFRDAASRRVPYLPLAVHSAAEASDSWTLPPESLIPFAVDEGRPLRLSVSEILDKDAVLANLHDRPIIIGMTAAGMGDQVITPLSGRRSGVAGVEVHAELLNALRAGHLIQPAGPAAAPALAALALLMTALLGNLRLERWRILIRLLPLVLLPSASFFLLQMGHIWIPPALALLTLASSLLVWFWLRQRQLFQYLNLRIARLQHEPSLNDLIPNGTAREWAHHLVFMLQPDRWGIFGAGETLPPADPDSHLLSVPVPGGQQTLRLVFARKRRDLPRIVAFLARHRKSQERHGERRGHIQILRSSELRDRIEQVELAILSLQQSRQFTADVLDRLGQGVMLADELGRLFFWNPAAVSLLDTKPTHGRSLDTLLDEQIKVRSGRRKSPWRELLRRAVLEDQATVEEVDAGERRLLLTLTPVQMMQGRNRGILLTCTDLTALHRAQQERNETLDFISHDLRSPLAAQIAVLENTRQSLHGGLEEGTAKALLDRLQTLTRRSLNLADDFLQLARVESATEILMHDCNLIDILDNAIDTQLPLARKQGVGLQNEAEDDALFLRGNPALLERAFGNLLNNAIKFSPADSIVRVTVERNASEVCVCVIDQGPGIPGEDRNRLFAAWSRTRHSEEQSIAGSGLGLRFVSRTVARHGGRVSLRDLPGHGACFETFLPIEPS